MGKIQRIKLTSALGKSLIAMTLGAWALSSHAQVCTIDNWQVAGVPSAENLTNEDNVGSTSAFRRFAGPCALRVPVDGENRYLTDGTPTSENTYNARFFAFFNNAGSDPILLFAADDGADDQIQVWYNVPAAGNLTLRVFDNAAAPNVTDLVDDAAANQWNSVEFSWNSIDQEVAFSVNGAEDLTATPELAGLSLSNARLGNLEGAGASGASGFIHFDDFDSRRTSRPPRLCRGLTVPEGTGPGQRNQLALGDVFAIFAEAASFGADRADGQPDFNRDGVVNLADANAVFARITGFQNACDLNR